MYKWKKTYTIIRILVEKACTLEIMGVSVLLINNP